MLIVRKNGKEYGPLVNLREMCELFGVSHDTMRMIIANSPELKAAQKSKQLYSLDLIDQLWQRNITKPFWQEETIEEESEAFSRLERLLKNSQPAKKRTARGHALFTEAQN